MKRKKALFKKMENKLPFIGQTKYQRTFFHFLTCDDLGNRTPFYIRQDIYQKIKCIVDVLGEGNITTSEYIDNILKHHLEEYREEINTIYRNLQKDLV